MSLFSVFLVNKSGFLACFRAIAERIRTVLLDKGTGFSLLCMVLLVLALICVQSFQDVSVVGAGRSFALVTTSILHFSLQSLLTGRRFA